MMTLYWKVMRIRKKNGGLNKGVFSPSVTETNIWNKNGCIFYRGKWATPKKDPLSIISEALTKSELKSLSIEKTKSGVVVIQDIK